MPVSSATIWVTPLTGVTASLLNVLAIRSPLINSVVELSSRDPTGDGRKPSIAEMEIRCRHGSTSQWAGSNPCGRRYQEKARPITGPSAEDFDQNLPGDAVLPR